RIARLDPQLNAFRVVWGERALADGAAADRRRANGDSAALLGVPIAIKDELAQVEGEVTTLGTGAVDEPASADSEMVRRLRSAGAVLLGKTNLPELAICGFTESKTWGITRNPWDPARTPGGSSGGSGAAVATGMVGAATGSDGAGSIRIPAANCGLFGLKPQRGRVTLAPLGEHWRGLSVNCCLSRTVRDTALFLDVTAGPAAGETSSPPPPERPFLEAADRPPDRLRVAVSMRPPRLLAPPIVDDSVRGAVEGTAELLRSLGHRTGERDPAFGLVGNAFTPVFLHGIHDDVRAVPHPERLESRTRGFGRMGGLIPRRSLRRALDAIPKHAQRIGRLFEDHDVLLTPTVGVPPVEVGRWEGKGALRTLIGMGRVYPFTGVWNYTGQPAAAVPAGFTTDGLPLSVQLVGRPGDEATLLSLAAQIEAERPWSERTPPVE
ncbi:MAG TPA: amidase, partial [Solirubrobacterales bacterium]|nr:amidase [Solirubrobacterales bacterium]